MSVSFKLDSYNNLIVSSDFLTIKDNEALIQDIKTRLKMFKGEYPFDTDSGVDYITLLQKNNQKELQNAIIQEIKKDSRVSEVIIENFSNKNQKLTLSLKIVTTSGDIVNV